MRFRLLSSLFLTAALPLAIGCGISANVPIADQPSAAIAGRAMGGQQPDAGATVSVWAVGTSGYGTGATQLAATTTDGGGNFQFAANAYTCPFANTPVYLLASGGNPGLGGNLTNSNLVLGAALGTCAAAKSEFAIVNEVTTAALAFSLGQFFTPTVGGAYTADLFGGTCTGCAAGTYNVGLVAASNNTYPMLVSNAAGQVNPNTATTTIEAAKIYTIANILAACVNTSGQTSTTETTTSCGQLFNFTKPTTGSRPLDTLQAAVQMSRIPYQNVTALYNLSTATPPFGGGLSAAPNDWTVGVSYTSAAFGLGINLDSLKGTNTTSNIDIDAGGKIWFPTNTVTSHGLGYFDPASSTFNGPFATTVLTPQYLAIDRRTPGNVFVTDMRSGVLTSTSVTAPTLAGAAYALPASAAGGPLTAFPDSNSSMAFTYASTASAYRTAFVYLGSSVTTDTNPLSQTPTSLFNSGGTSAPGQDQIIVLESTANSGCKADRIASGNRVITVLSFGSAIGQCQLGSGATFFDSINRFLPFSFVAVGSANVYAETAFNQLITPTVPLNKTQQADSDGNNNAWFSNSGNASVSTLAANLFQDSGQATSPIAYLHGPGNGGTMTTPYGLAVDRSGNVWVSNAGCVSTTSAICAPGSFILSELIGAAAPTLTPLGAAIISNPPYTKLPNN